MTMFKNEFFERFSYAQKLKKLRIMAGLKQQDVANYCNIQRSNYCNMENGLAKFNPNAANYIISEFKQVRDLKIWNLKKEINDLNSISLEDYNLHNQC